MGKVGVVFEIGVQVWPIGVCALWSTGLIKTKISGIRNTLKSIGESVETQWIKDFFLFFGDLRDDRFVLRSLRSLINAFLPLGKPRETVLQLFDTLFVLWIDRLLRFNAIGC